MAKVLVVDDVWINRRIMQRYLESMGHQVILGASGEEALARLDQSIDILLLDVRLPGMDGYSAVEVIRSMSDYEDLPIIMVTTLDGRNERLQAAQAGANDFIAKPVERIELEVRMSSLLRLKKARDELKAQQATLEAMVEERTTDLAQALAGQHLLQRQVSSAHLETVVCLATAAEFKDDNTAAHLRRIAELSVLFGRALGLSEEEIETLRHASTLHDVGKIGIPENILLKPGPLTPAERKVMERHTLIGAQILGSANSSLLRTGRIIALSHHERWDGSGYPQGLSKDDIPFEGRLCAIVDVYDALRCERPYKTSLGHREALDTMSRLRGSHFDPDLLDVFMSLEAHAHRVFEHSTQAGSIEMPAKRQSEFSGEFAMMSCG